MRVYLDNCTFNRPFDDQIEERRNTIQNWKAHAFIDVDANLEILTKANVLREIGLRNKDALHLACSVAAKCDYFVTTDDAILRKTVSFGDIKVIDPLNFIRSVFHDNR